MISDMYARWDSMRWGWEVARIAVYVQKLVTHDRREHTSLIFGLAVGRSWVSGAASGFLATPTLSGRNSAISTYWSDLTFEASLAGTGGVAEVNLKAVPPGRGDG